MSKFFFIRFAWGNIKKNHIFYKPYILTGAITAALFFIMLQTANNRYLSDATHSMSMPTILTLGAVVIAVFAIIYVFYIDSFVMKRRHKEFALYNMLGMEKRHIARMILTESLMCWLMISALGVVLGTVFSKLVLMCLQKLIRLETELKFCFDMTSLIMTFVIFGFSILITAFYHIIVLKFANISRMMNESTAGEKEPKARVLLAIAGVLMLGAGYIIAIVIKRPVIAAFYFMVAVILVIIGTYLLFIVGSVALLKHLKNQKKFYYKPNHFAAVSGLIFRMKQNAAGLASICILSTMMLVVISATVSMYVGVEKSIHENYPNDVQIWFSGESIESSKAGMDEIENYLKESIDANDADIVNHIRYSMVWTCLIEKDTGVYACYETLDDMDAFDLVYVNIITCEAYNKLTEEDVSLLDDEILVYANVGLNDMLRIDDQTFKIAEQLDHFPVSGYESNFIDSIYMVVSDTEKQEDLYYAFSNELETYGLKSEFRENLQFDIDIPVNEKLSFERDLHEKIYTFVRAPEFYQNREGGHSYSIAFKEVARESLIAETGGMLFVGIFFGVVFLVGTVVIIYFKQVSEGYMDRERYVIMQKVGMSGAEVKHTIHSQIVMVFFLPLVTAAIHTLMASSLLNKLLAIYAIDNYTMLLLCMFCIILAFAVMYCIIYKLTAKIYYNIVKI